MTADSTKNREQRTENRSRSSVIGRRSSVFRKGFTIAEVLVASLLLTSAMVPILRALTGAHTLDVKIERRTHSLTLAEAKLEDIKARSIYSYADNFSDTSSSLDGPYLCRVLDNALGADTRSVAVFVGYDNNSNSSLEDDEVQVCLKTLIARRW